MVGVSMIATDLMQALHARSGCRMALLSPLLTFHYVAGDSVVKHPQNQRARNDRIFTGLYTAWNCAQFARNRRDILIRYPDYEQCWFNHQAEWSVYTYQCAMTIDHLPHEFKLLWHNHSLNDAPSASRSNCNLPSICHQCRGRDGSKRPGADLMNPLPCGFCRCSSDLKDTSRDAVYVTPPDTLTPPVNQRQLGAQAQQKLQPWQNGAHQHQHQQQQQPQLEVSPQQKQPPQSDPQPEQQQPQTGAEEVDEEAAEEVM
uniref:Uncharacterized protein n=1 Tax=Haptolina brevifila TaxID=156173 RepID=A0A7S2JDN4_9EUKA